MGNCQATDAAAIVIQRRGGRTEKLYWPIPAAEVMRSNPGHYVALTSSTQDMSRSQGSRLKRVRLLRPKDTLLLGHVYLLVTSHEVMKGMRAKKREKREGEGFEVGVENCGKTLGGEERGCGGRGRSRQWRPSLQSIEEVGG